jgi:hypothetical protein
LAENISTAPEVVLKNLNRITQDEAAEAPTTATTNNNNGGEQ